MKQYFCNAELDFSGAGGWRDVLALHQITQADARDYCVEVTFAANGASETAQILGEIAPDHPWSQQVAGAVAGGSLRALETAPHAVWQSVANPAGRNRLGGPMPTGLVAPASTDFASGYCYVGTLSAQDPAFSCLPQDVHLFWPLFAGYHPPLFLDIRDPLGPRCLPRDRCAMFEASTGAPRSLADKAYFMDIEEEPEIEALFADGPAEPIFESEPFDMGPKSGLDETLVHAGAPVWVQYPEVPLDPATGRPMRFLCQIMDGPDLLTVRARPESHSVFAPDFERMAFWGDGVLFVFVSEDAQTLCLVVQNT